MNLLYNKITNKLKKISRRFIPYNTRFRPGGICRLKSDGLFSTMSSEVTVHSIYPNEVTSLTIPEALYEACSEYWKPKRRVETNYIVVDIPNGRIYTDNESSVAIVTKYNRIVENVSLSMVDGKVVEPNLNNIFEQRFFTKPKKIEGTVFSLLTGGAGLNNISHWFLDVLPRLHLLRESGLYKQIDWFLVPSLHYDFQVETLDLLEIPREKIITSENYPHLAADRIIASTAPRGNHTLVPSWLCEYIQSSFLPLADEIDLPMETPSHIYISRSDSKIRNILNEKELVNELESLGFETIISSKLSVKEKIKLFSNAKVVISATGAGLISMLFCKPGTKMIEIFNEGFVVEPFYDIATKIGLNYEYIICKGIRTVKNVTQGQRENLFVDVEEVVHFIKKQEQIKIQKQEGVDVA